MITNAEIPIPPAILSRTHRKGLYSTLRHLRTPIQTRKLWRGTGQTQENSNNYGQRRMKIYRRFDLVRMWGSPVHPWPAQIHNRHHRWWERPTPNPPERKRETHPPQDFWAGDRSHIQKRIAQIKKEIETDPYGALFGRRLEPFTALNKFEDTCASLYRSLFSHDKLGKTGSMDTSARSKPSKNSSTEKPEKQSPASMKPGNGAVAGTSRKTKISQYEFDPISGRMVLKKPRLTEAITEKGPAGMGTVNKPNKDPETHGKRSTGYLSSMDRTGIESKAAPMGSFDSGNPGSSSLGPELEKDPGPRIGSEKTSAASRKEDGGLREPPRKDSCTGSATRATGNKFDHHGPSPEISSNTDHAKSVGYNCPESSHAASHDGLPPEKSTCNNRRYMVANSEDAKEKTEDLDTLQANDIRSRYDPEKFGRGSKMQNQAKNELNEVSNRSADLTSNLESQDVRKESETHGQKQHLDKVASESYVSSQIVPKGTTGSQNPEKCESTRQLSRSNSRFAETYRVLAYDPSTLQITHAEASSSSDRMNESYHPSEILCRLNNPAKFLPYFERMHADGYEISSGGGDILVFRKSAGKPEYTWSALGQMASEAQEIKAQLRDEPLLDEAKSVSKPYSALGAEDAGSADPSRPPASDGECSRRDKANSSESESTIRSAARRMLISGAATAATCYAIGVVVEYFRTGGEDGLGIDAFTVFESERRRRDMEQTDERSY